MNLSGVRLADGTMVWADFGELSAESLETVVVELGGQRLTGWVCITPPQLLEGPGRVDARVVSIEPYSMDVESCAELPGAELPVLGSRLLIEGEMALVTAIDAVRRAVWVETPDGRTIEVAQSSLESEAPDSS